MAVRSRFTPRVPQAPTGRKLSTNVVKDMRGLNSTDPYGILEMSASPYLRNARMYLNEENRQVAISTRRGTDFYTTPVGEASADSEASTAGADEVTVSSVQWVAQKVTPDTTGSVTKAEVNIKTATGTAPVMIRFYTDDSGAPGDLLATSSILNADITNSLAYAEARFIEAPNVTATTDYWLVVAVQIADSDTYTLSTTTNSTDALTSPNAGNTWASASYSINFDLDVAPTGEVKGAFRYYPSDGDTETLFAHLDDVYKVNDVTGAATSIIGSLSSNGSRYRFTQFRDKVYFANGTNNLKEYDGTTVSEPGALSVPSIVVSHKNRLFIVSATDPNRLEFSELADAETWESTSFIYAPEPQSSDPIVGLVSFQDTLVIFTANNKYVLYGSDLGDFQVRQTLGKQGAVSQEAITTDDNYVYFVSSDGHMYRWNGSKDEQLSRKIEGDFDDVANVNNSRLLYENDRVHWFFQSTGQVSYDSAFVYETRYEEWFYDTGRCINGGITYGQEGDKKILQSCRVGALYYGSEGYSDLGRPIDFRYHTNYFDFGRPDSFKQVRRLYLQFRKTTWVGTISVGSDADFKDEPLEEEVNVQAEGAIWGEFTWGSFVWGAGDKYFRHRMTVAGQATHFQVRIRKNGVETPVYFIGYSQHYRLRRSA